MKYDANGKYAGSTTYKMDPKSGKPVTGKNGKPIVLNETNKNGTTAHYDPKSGAKTKEVTKGGTVRDFDPKTGNKTKEVNSKGTASFYDPKTGVKRAQVSKDGNHRVDFDSSGNKTKEVHGSRESTFSRKGNKEVETVQYKGKNGKMVNAGTMERNYGKDSRGRTVVVSSNKTVYVTNNRFYSNTTVINRTYYRSSYGYVGYVPSFYGYRSWAPAYYGTPYYYNSFYTGWGVGLGWGWSSPYVRYNWGWSPYSYGYYDPYYGSAYVYYHPYVTYTSPLLWAVDWLLGSYYTPTTAIDQQAAADANQAAANANQAAANANQAAANLATQQGNASTPAAIDEATKEQIKEAVKQAMQEQQAATALAATDEEKAKAQAAENADIQKQLNGQVSLDIQKRKPYVLHSNIDVDTTDAAGATKTISLSPGDVIKFVNFVQPDADTTSTNDAATPAADPQPTMAIVRVIAAKGGEFEKGDSREVTISLETFQEVENEFRGKVSDSLEQMEKNKDKFQQGQ